MVLRKRGSVLNGRPSSDAQWFRLKEKEHRAGTMKLHAALLHKPRRTEGKA